MNTNAACAGRTPTLQLSVLLATTRPCRKSAGGRVSTALRICFGLCWFVSQRSVQYLLHSSTTLHSLATASALLSTSSSAPAVSQGRRRSSPLQSPHFCPRPAQANMFISSPGGRPACSPTTRCRERVAAGGNSHHQWLSQPAKYSSDGAQLY